MRFETARQAINHAKSFHIRLGKFYALLATDENSQKAALLLNYLIKHEKDAADALGNYEKDTSTGVLDTYLQFANDQNILQIPEFETLQTDKLIEYVAELAMKFSDELIELYSQVAQEVDEIQLTEIFTNLVDMQKQEKRILSMNIDRMMDI